MKKILCLIDSLGAGGAQRQMVGLASLLKEKGYDVTFAIYYNDLFYEDVLMAKDVPYVYLNEAFGVRKRIVKIAKFIKSERPDVVVAFLETPSICACIAKLLCGKFQLIVSERNTTQHTGWNERIRFNLFRIADFIVPNSFSQTNYINSLFSFLAPKTITIPNFVDLNIFIPPIKRTKKEVPEIMIAASIWASKNTLGFIDAVAALKQKGYQFHISWYGLNTKWLDYIRHCQEKIYKMGLNEVIVLKEKTTHIQECYQNSDYFCLPSFYEGTPNVICEAMACGLPVACSDVCDNSRYVEDGENGYLFDPLNSDSIVMALERLLTLNDDEYDSYCRRSRERAEKKFSPEIFVNSYIKLIKE